MTNVLEQLDRLTIARMRMSVGYGRQKKGRPFSPIEISHLLEDGCVKGASLEEWAHVLGLRGTSQLQRFLRVLGLPRDLHHRIGWGRSRGHLGFSTAVELLRVVGAKSQRLVADAALEHGLTSKEVRQIAQLQRRAGRSIGDCLREVLRMRPVVEKRYVLVGSVADEATEAHLRKLSQAERNELLANGIAALDVTDVAGHLGTELFTLVLDERSYRALQGMGSEGVESQLRMYIAKGIQDVQSEG